MADQPIILVCGVPGSGKTWVCEQLTHKYQYVANDDHIGDHQKITILDMLRKSSPKPVLTDCPFGERALRDELVRRGCTVRPYFIVEAPSVVKDRYQRRQLIVCPQNILSRAKSIKQRAIEWHAPYGTSSEILEMLRDT